MAGRFQAQNIPLRAYGLPASAEVTGARRKLVMMVSLHNKGISIYLIFNILHLDWDSSYSITYICQNPSNSTCLMSILLHTNDASIQFTSKNEGTLLTLLDLLGKSHALPERRVRDASVETMKRTFYFTSLGEWAGVSLGPMVLPDVWGHILWIPFLEFQ